MKKKITSLILLFFLIISCNKETKYLVNNTGKTIFYEIEFQDKDNNKDIYRQSYHFLPSKKNLVPVIKNNGEMIVYLQKRNGISKMIIKDNQLVNSENLIRNHDLKRIIAFPVSVVCVSGRSCLQPMSFKLTSLIDFGSRACTSMSLFKLLVAKIISIICIFYWWW